MHLKQDLGFVGTHVDVNDEATKVCCYSFGDIDYKFVLILLPKLVPVRPPNHTHLGCRGCDRRTPCGPGPRAPELLKRLGLVGGLRPRRDLSY